MVSPVMHQIETPTRQVLVPRGRAGAHRDYIPHLGMSPTATIHANVDREVQAGRHQLGGGIGVRVRVECLTAWLRGAGFVAGDGRSERVSPETPYRV